MNSLPMDDAGDSALTREQLMLRELFKDHFKLADRFEAAATKMAEIEKSLSSTGGQPDKHLAELKDAIKKIDSLESELEKLRATNARFSESMNGSREMQFVSARDWAISGAIAGMIGGGIFGIGIAIFAVVTKIIVL